MLEIPILTRRWYFPHKKMCFFLFYPSIHKFRLIAASFFWDWIFFFSICGWGWGCVGCVGVFACVGGLWVWVCGCVEMLQKKMSYFHLNDYIKYMPSLNWVSSQRLVSWVVNKSKWNVFAQLCQRERVIYPPWICKIYWVELWAKIMQMPKMPVTTLCRRFLHTRKIKHVNKKPRFYLDCNCFKS